MKTCIINTLFVIESLTIVNLLNKVQFPFVKVFPPQMLSSSSEGAIVQAVPIAFAPVISIKGSKNGSAAVKNINRNTFNTYYIFVPYADEADDC